MVKAGTKMRLKGYSNLVKIGEGGMALVYRGIQDSLERPVAIKVLIQDLGDHDEARRRFERESFIIARLNHPNIIHVIDRGITREGMPYFIMEFVEGTELGNAAQVMQLTHYQKIDIIIQLLKALSYAHRNNVVHRDIKPDNILVDDDGNIKILDFGIAQFYDDQNLLEENTSHGTIMGTYSYMSPEQRVSADKVTAQSDLYSVGVLMYKLFTDKFPEGVFAPPSRLNSEVSSELDRIILRCLMADPSERPESAEALKTDLLNVMQGAHIGIEQKRRAEQGITEIKSRFQLLDVLREDKYGAVYLFQQKTSGNLLVIKKKICSSSGFQVSNTLATLQHENILATLGTSRNEKIFVLVQEYLSGGTLQDKLACQLGWHDSLKIARQICSALLFAHSNNIVHGHLRPTNILFTDAGQVKLTDFSLQDDTSLIVTAPFYRLPGEPISRAADVYSTGVLLSQLFTGCLPRRHNDEGFVLRKSFTVLPGDIQELIKSMLAKVPQHRGEDALEKALKIVEEHLAKPERTQINKPAREPRRRDDVPPVKNIAAHESVPIPLLHKESPQQDRNGRTMKMFGVLLLMFSQYLLFFDGQQIIADNLPWVYNQVSSGVDILFGG
jgi:eukaryotic-like serine/threonine-protein kinase